MRALVLTGSKYQIAGEVAAIEGEIREAIVFVEEPVVVAQAPAAAATDIFAEMESLSVSRMDVDDSRESVYRRSEGE